MSAFKSPKSCDSELNPEALSITGPFPQTMFLGCSIVSFTASVGWNEQTTDVVVQLVEDSCPTWDFANGDPPTSIPFKTYYDENLDIQKWYLADPGFAGLYKDIIGAPVYFRIGDFEFCGIIQSWDESFSKSGNPTYSVMIIDPRLLLENSKVIINGYAGNIGEISNVFNVFGFLESIRVPLPPDNLAISVDSPQLSLHNGSYGFNDGFELGVNTGIDWLPDGATFGSPAQAYGNAQVNSNGILWSKLFLGLNLLINATPKLQNLWSSHGRITFKGVADIRYKAARRVDNFEIPREAGKRILKPKIWDDFSPGYTGGGLIHYDGSEVIDFVTGIDYYNEYFLDISDLPSPPTYWRISGNSLTIKDIIAQICEATGHDYYIELIFIKSNLSPSKVAKLIKVRTVKRLLQPVIGTIDQLIGEGSQTISASKGLELRNETNSSILIGGKKETLYQMRNPYTVQTMDGEQYINTIYPYFGIDAITENVIMPFKFSDTTNYKLGDKWSILVDAAPINNQLVMLDKIGILDEDEESPTYNKYIALITEYEMMAALGGFDMWMSTVTSLGQFFYEGWPYSSTGKCFLDSDIGFGTYDIYTLINAIRDNVLAGVILPTNVMSQARRVKLEKRQARRWEELQLVYQWIKSFAENLGKKFMLQVPWTAGRYDLESNKVITMDSPTSAGWTEQTFVLGIPTFSELSMPIRNEENKICALIVMEDNEGDEQIIPKDINYLGDTYGIYNGYIYIKANVDSEYVYGNHDYMINPYAVLTIAGPVPNPGNAKYPQNCRGIFTMMEIIKKLDDGIGNIDDLAKKMVDDQDKIVGGKQLHLSMPYYFDTNPVAATCGIKSDVMTYGPWFKKGPIGGTKVETDEDLVPWTYGGYSIMQVVGQAMADEGVTRMRVGEKGEITIPGYPTLPLGAELGAIAGGLFTAASQCIENRFVSANSAGDYSFAFWQSPGIWEGIYGPNITSISVSVGTNGVQTSYSMKTYTPGFGKFAKTNADRLKKLNKYQVQNQKRFLKKATPYVEGAINQRIREGKREFRVSTKDQGILMEVHTPHQLLAGSMVHNSGAISGQILSYNSVATSPVVEVYNEFSGWEAKAFMSMDGLLRPVSIIENLGSGSGSGSGGGSDIRLPLLATSYGSGIKTTTRPILPFVIDGGNRVASGVPSITASFLQPFQFRDTGTPNYTGALTYTSGAGPTYGCHDVLIVGHGSSGFPDGSNNQGIVLPDFMGIISGTDLNDGMRVMALKGPLLMQSWGYNTHGKPVPNLSDTDIETNRGIFHSKTDYFMPGWLNKSHTWPVGPVDLRWDENRAVWTAPPSYRLINGILDCALASSIYTEGSTTGIARINLRASDNEMTDTAGNIVAGDTLKIPVKDLTGQTTASGEKILAMYDAFHEDYIIIGSRGSSGGTKISYYLMLTDIDGDVDTPLGFVNPLIWDGTNYQWLPDPDHLDDDGYPVIDPEWSKIIVDTTRSMGCWEDDFVTAQDLTETYVSSYTDKNGDSQTGTFSMVEFVNRMSSQSRYVAYVPPDWLLYPQQSWNGISIYINGLEKIRTVWDLGLIAAGTFLLSPPGEGMFIEVTYMQDLRKWCVTGAQCEMSVGF
jgi:hypothetical protein